LTRAAGSGDRISLALAVHKPYAGIAVLLDNLAAAALSDLTQFTDLIFNRLLVGANANVDCRTPTTPSIARIICQQVFRSLVSIGFLDRRN